MAILERLTNKGIKIKDCPFCGCKLSDFPIVMILRPEHSEEYLLAKLNKGHFLGFDNGYLVRCIHCGASGGRDTCPEQAVKKWNRRAGNGKAENHS